MSTDIDVLFVDNFFYERRQSNEIVTRYVPHLGLLSLITQLSYSSSIFDPKLLFYKLRKKSADDTFYHSCAKMILDVNPKVVGFTCYGRSFLFVSKLAKLLKTLDPSVKIILGGPHASIVGRQILQTHQSIDLVVKFEAEATIEAIVYALINDQPLIDIPNLLLREKGDIRNTHSGNVLFDINCLRPLNYTKYINDNLPTLDCLPIEVGRGCPFECKFCSTSQFFSRRYRLRDVQSLVQEIVVLNATTGVTKFDLNHDLFGLNKDFVHRFCDCMKGLNLRWSCSMRPDIVSKEMCSVLAESNCTAIYFGFESGSEKIQELSSKKLKICEAIENIQIVTEQKISVTVSFITGFPFETKVDLMETLDVISKLLFSNYPLIHLQLHMLSPEPGTVLYQQYKDQLKFEGSGPELFEELDLQEVEKEPEIYSVYYSFPTLMELKYFRIASHLVNYEFVSLGYPIVMFILKNFYRCKLSQFVEDILSHFPFDEAEVSVHKGLNTAYASLQGNGCRESSILNDILLFFEGSKRLQPVQLDRQLDELTDHQLEGILKMGILVSYTYDFRAFLQAVVANPFMRLTEATISRGRYEYFMFKASDGNIKMVETARHSEVVKLYL